MKNTYNYLENDIIHCIDLKQGQNKKLGENKLLIQTYHFSIEQVESNDIKQDSKNCLDCPLSFNQSKNDKSSCYTHKGLQLLGLKSKLRSLHLNRNKIKPFDQKEFNKFVSDASKKDIDLIRFGTYGEPVLMEKTVIIELNKLSKKRTGYTHQYNKPKYKDYNLFFMASTHTERETKQAQNENWRTFTVSNNALNSILCPASKEAGNKTTCAKCALCDGFNTKKSIYIPKH